MLPRIYNIEKIRDFLYLLVEDVIENDQQFHTIQSKLKSKENVLTFFKENYKISKQILIKHYFHALLFLNLAERDNSKKDSTYYKVNLNEIRQIFSLSSLGKELSGTEKLFFRRKLLYAVKVTPTASQDYNIRNIKANLNFFTTILEEIQHKEKDFMLFKDGNRNIELISEKDVRITINDMFLDRISHYTLKSEKTTFEKWGMDLNFLVYFPKILIRKYFNLNEGLYYICKENSSYNHLKSTFIKIYQDLAIRESIVELPKINILTCLLTKTSFDNYKNFLENFITKNRSRISLGSYIPSLDDEILQNELKKWNYEDKRSYYYSIKIKSGK